MRRKKRTVGHFGAPMECMIDVVFLLLVFFVATAAITQTEAHVKTRAPSASPVVSQVLSPALLRIHVTAEGLAIGTGKSMRPVSLDELREHLADSTKLDPDMKFMVIVDGNVRQQALIDTLDACKQVGAENILLNRARD